MITSFMQLVPRYLMYNKKRTLTISFSIIFSVTLLTSVSIIINSYNEMAIYAMGQMFGKYHGEFINIEYDNLGKPKNLPIIKTIGTTLNLGEYKSEEYKLDIIGSDNNAMDMLNCNIIKGNYPQNINEIMMEEWVINKMELKPAIGDKLSLDYEMVNTKGLSIGRSKTDFILSGIMENSYGTLAADKGKAFVTLQTAEQHIEKYDRSYRQYFAMDTSPNIRQELAKVRELLNKRAENENVFGDYNENEGYVDSLESAYKSRKLTFFIDAIVALVAVMVIFNVFNISIIERLKHFGLLRSIGTTPDQIKYMLLAEALLLGLICIPIGIAAGVLGTHLLLFITSKIGLFKSNVSISLFSIVLPFIMGFLSILIAVYNSAKFGARVSPIESINLESKIRKKQTDIKSFSNKLILSIYGQMGKMALTNIGRYKKRFFATIVTISISIALFISVFYLIKGLDPVHQISNLMTADYVLTYEFNRERNGYTEEAIKQLESVEGIKMFNKLKYISCNIHIDTDLLTKKGKEYYEKEAKTNDYISNLLNRNQVDLVCFAIGLNEEIYNKHFKDMEEISNYKSQGEALPYAFVMQNLSHKDHTDLSSGDSVLIAFPYKEDDRWKKIEQEFVIMDTIDTPPVAISKGNGSIAIFMKEEFLEKYYSINGYQKIEIYLENSADMKEIEERLRGIASSQKYGKLISFWEDVEKIKKLQTQLALVLYSIVAVVFLVSLVNIVNTMSMNIILRKKEFGILRAIGVTKPQLREMIFKEGLLYGVIGSLFGSLIGIGLIYIIYYFARRILYIEFRIDYLSILFTSVTTIILCITATLIPIKKVTSASVIESIGAVE